MEKSSTRALWSPLFLCTQSVVSTKGSIGRAYTQVKASVSQLPGSLSVPYKPGCGRQWELPQIPAGESKCLSIYPHPTRAYLWSSTSQISYCLSHRVNSFRIAQLSVQRVNGWGTGQITCQTVSSAHWLLWFITISIQAVSVLAWVMTIVLVGRLPWLSFCILGIYGNFPHSSAGHRGHDRNRVGGICSICILYRA